MLKRAQMAYDRVIALRAEFSQTIINPMLGDPELSHGVLFLSPPDRFAMRFEEPEGDRLVADGTWLWVYTPSTVPDQVIRQPIPKTGTATPNLFSQFVDRPHQRYTATYLRPDTVDTTPVDLVRLVPRTADLPFREVVIAISRTDGMMRTLWFREESGQERELTFARITLSREVPSEEVTFNVPRGVRVVTLP